MKSPADILSVRSPSACGRSLLLASVLALGLLPTAFSSLGSSYIWAASSAGNYTTGANWSPAGPPGTADTAIVGGTGYLTPGECQHSDSSANALTVFQIGQVAGSSGTFTLSAGTLSITNASAAGLFVGNAGGNASGNFNMYGGVLNLVKNSATFYQDFVQIGNSAGGSGTFTLTNGTVNCFGGIELGSGGVATLNVTNGVLIDGSWFGVGRGGSSHNGSGTFNLAGGTVYLLRNPGTESGSCGLSYCQQGTNGTVNISGGALYCYLIRFSAGPGSSTVTDWETLNVSGGDLYIGGLGIYNKNAAGIHNRYITLSGGTFHTVDLGPNTTGMDGLASVLTDGTNWTWDATLPATLSTTPGPGYVTFAPEANRTITLSNVFSGAGGLTVTGPGTVDIEGANAYTGDTTLSGGTVSGSGSVQGNVTATSGATIAPGSAPGSANVVPATLTLGNSLTLNGNTNVIKLSGNPFSIGGGVNDLLSTLGDLTLQNVCTIKVVPLAPLSPDYPYTILQYGGTALTSGDAAHLRVISDSPRYSFSVLDPSNTYPYIQVNVNGNAANLVWRGGAVSNPTAWDHATANWFNTGTSASDVFYNGDATAFDDSALTNLVTVVDNDQASVIAMSNNVVPFTFAGSGLLTGPLDLEGTSSLTLALSTVPASAGITANSGALVFNLANGGINTLSAPISDNGLGAGAIIQGGTNTLVLSGANSLYYGALMVTNGVLRYTAAAALGAGSTLYATNHGTLDFNHVNAQTKTVVVAGAGYNGMGALTDTGTGLGVNTVVDHITLAGDTTFGAVGRWEQPNSGTSFAGNGFNLTAVGSGVILLNNDGETQLGNIHIVGGRLGFENSTTLGDAAKTLTVESNAVVTFYNNGTMNKSMVLNNGALIDAAGAANNFAGAVTLVGTNTIATRNDLHLSGPVGGAGGFIVETNDPAGSGSGVLYLEGANTYNGVTILNQGSTVNVGAGSSLGASSFISLNTGSTLNVSALAPLSLGTGQTLVGLGTVIGDIAFGSGSTLSVGLSASSAATLTVNGNLAFQAGSTNIMKVNPGNSHSDLVTGLSSVTYGGTLVVTKIGASAFAANTTFNLFSATTYNPSSFAAVVLPSPGAGLAWDISGLTVDGTIKVISQPQFTSIAPLSDGNFQFTFTGNVGSPYSLRATTNVALPLGSWAVLSSGTVSSSPLTLQDLTATNYARRFYIITMP